jgi:cobalt/nickel transport system permease protein
MHIPDGFVSPATWIATTVIAIPLLIKAVKKTREVMSDNASSFSIISTLTAFSFVLMMFNIPIPGGTSGHAVGAGMLAILFGPWVGALSISLVLFIQAIIFGDGGLTTFGLNSIAMGFGGSFSAYFAYKFLSNKLNDNIALFFAGWFSIVAASVIVAAMLGLQPLIATSADGQPLYFPFGLEVTIPAVVGSHMLAFGFIEGIVTMFVVQFVRKTNSVEAIA